MKNLKIKYKILIPVAFLILVVLGGSALQYKSSSEISAQTDLISDDLLPRIRTVLEMNLDLSNYRRSQYNVILANTPEDRKKYRDKLENSKLKFEKGLIEYGKMIHPDQDEQQGFFKTINEKWAQYEDESKIMMGLNDQGNTEAAINALRETGGLYDATSEAVGGIVKVNERNATNAGIVADTEAHQGSIIAVSVVLAIMAVCFALTIALIRGVAKPIVNITGYMGVLASGDLSKDVPDRDRKDEVGEMAMAIQIFKDNMVRAKELEAEQRVEEQKKQARQEKINHATKKFETAMQEIVRFVSSSSTELQASAQSLAASAEETSKQSSVVAAAAQQAAANVQTVSSASEELSSSINEISSQVTRSSQVASRAVEDARRAGANVSELVNAAQKIGEVTSLISSIAEQTNLLALNATIEAARAGEAGKGFAVVAAEVKNLATESTKATEEITSKIQEIQNISNSSAASINEICRVIEEIDQISGSISAAINQQSAATQEISRNVTEAYTGTSEVTQNIVSVNDAANDTGSASTQVLSAANELAKQSTILKNAFDAFIHEVETA